MKRLFFTIGYVAAALNRRRKTQAVISRISDLECLTLRRGIDAQGRFRCIAIPIFDEPVTRLREAGL
jgi:hypothetical protein